MKYRTAGAAIAVMLFLSSLASFAFLTFTAAAEDGTTTTSVPPTTTTTLPDDGWQFPDIGAAISEFFSGMFQPLLDWLGGVMQW